MTTINMTCRNCSKPFKRRTRKGSRTQCPHCGEWQNGPAANEAQREQLAELERQKAEKNQRDAERRAQKPKPAAKRAAPAKGPRKVDSPRQESPSSEAQEPVAVASGTTDVGKIPTPPERKEPEERHAGWLF